MEETSQQISAFGLADHDERKHHEIPTSANDRSEPTASRSPDQVASEDGEGNRPDNEEIPFSSSKSSVPQPPPLCVESDLYAPHSVVNTTPQPTSRRGKDEDVIVSLFEADHRLGGIYPLNQQQGKWQSLPEYQLQNNPQKI